MNHLEFSQQLAQFLGDKSGLAQFAVEKIVIDGDDVLIPPDYYDNLLTRVKNDVVMQGNVKVIQDYNEYRDSSAFKSGGDYESDIVENPTWLDLMAIANEMIETTKDTTHINIKGIELVQEIDDIQLCRFKLSPIEE